MLSICFSMSALLISLFILYNLFRLSRVKNEQNMFFVAFILSNCFTAFSMLCGDMAEMYHIPNAVAVMDVMSFLYYVLHIIAGICFYLYILSHIRAWRSLNKLQRAAILFPTIVAEAIIMLNPWLHWIYYYDELGEYHRGKYIAIVYAVTAVYLIGVVYQTVINRREISIRKVIIVMSGLAFSVVSVILQLFIPNSAIETVSIAIVTLVFFLTIQNPRENLDPEMSVFSRHAFEDMIHSYYLSGRDFRFICIYVDDYAEHTGMENDPELVAEFVEFLNTVGAGTNIYHIDRAEFAIEVTDPVPGQIDKIIADIRIRFERPWRIFGRDELLSVSILSLRLPEDVKAEPVFYSVLRQFHDREKTKSVYTARDLEIKDIERDHQITVALSRAIEKKTLEMRYTPVYSLGRKKVSGLIATVRFFDEATGYVYDDEIFHFAESGGYIMHVANILFEKTAVFIKENRLQEAGVDFVGIRVYPTMTMHYNLLTGMFDYMEKNDIDKNRVYIMMSESTLANATESFRRTIKHLDEMGGRFCLEEYGGGYTDISTIYDMPIDVISINRRVVADAVSNKSAKLAMESAMDLAHHLNMKTMVSGINDAEFYSMIESTDCDYATGGYFFEQLDEQGFIRVLADSNESGGDTAGNEPGTGGKGEAT